jgi:energy-coupling factor transport system permease protein
MIDGFILICAKGVGGLVEQKFKAAKPDPRILILQIIVMSVLSFSFGNWTAVILLFVAVDVLIWIFFDWRTSAKFLWGYLGALFFLQLLQKVYIPVLSFLFPMILMVIIRVMPVYMSCSILVGKTPMNELLAALRKLHIPMIVLIPVAVMYRYIPTIRQEIVYVRESLVMRGLHSSVWKVLRHPVRSMEHFIIPLLFRSEKITEELSAATLCKGLSFERERTCCTDVKLEKEDYLYLLLFFIAVGVLIYINTHLYLF